MASKIKAPLKDILRNGAAIKSAELAREMNWMNANRRSEINKRRTVTELFVENIFRLPQPGRGYAHCHGCLAGRLRHQLKGKPFDHYPRNFVRHAEFAVEPCRELG